MAPTRPVDVDVIPPGIRREGLEPWLAQHIGELAPPLSYDRLTGGRSNLTYRLTDRTGRAIVLRRPPLGHVLESAHDVTREHRILSALTPTAIPVARPLGVCSDPAVNGAPFYVMEFVDGVVVSHVEEVADRLSPAARRAAAFSLVDTLARLHAIDPESVGLGDLGPTEHYAERQLRRWHRQFHSATNRQVPAIDETHRRLTAAVPAQRRTGIVHGDFKINNCILAPEGSVRAVLDWELSTLGDPLADVGMLMVYWAEPQDELARMLTGTATAAPGFPGRTEILDRYANLSGADLSALNFYVALGYWKMACIYEGIRIRYAAGVMADSTASPVSLDRHVEWLANVALSHAERLP